MGDTAAGTEVEDVDGRPVRVAYMPLEPDEVDELTGDDNLLEVIVVADILELLNLEPHRSTKLLLRTALADPSGWRTLQIVRVLGDNGASTGRRQPMRILLRIGL